jgi:hypothetical protein
MTLVDAYIRVQALHPFERTPPFSYTDSSGVRRYYIPIDQFDQKIPPIWLDFLYWLGVLKPHPKYNFVPPDNTYYID